MNKVISRDAVLVPDQAELVFRGQIFNVYQWPQKMFDGSIKTFEMLKRADTVQSIAVIKDQLVIIEDEQPGRPLQVHFSGGRADDGDKDWLEAAKRELREETGMTFNHWRHLTADQPAAKIEWFTPIFLATEFDKQLEQQVDRDGEKIKVKMMDFDKVRSLVLSSRYPMMSYLAPLFARVNSLEELLNFPEFKGQKVDR